MTPKKGLVSGCSYITKAVVMSSKDIDRALRRIAHEVVEKNRTNDEIVVVGLQTGGVWIANRIADLLINLGDSPVGIGYLDISLYRDDLSFRPLVNSSVTNVPVSVEEKTVLLIDDVLFTGRTVRAALDAIVSFGRPRSIQLAVMVDRGHRELPIRPDYVGKNLPTSRNEMVEVSLDGVRIMEEVLDGS